MAEPRERGGTGGGLTDAAAPPLITPEARHEMRTTAQLIRAGTGQAIDEARQLVREVAEEQKKKAAEAVGGIARTLQRSAGTMTTENETMARYTQIAAERLDDVARYLRQSSSNDLVEGAENFARRQPAWFIGGALVSGFLVARFLKSSPEAYGRAKGEIQ